MAGVAFGELACVQVDRVAAHLRLLRVAAAAGGERLAGAALEVRDDALRRDHGGVLDGAFRSGPVDAERERGGALVAVRVVVVELVLGGVPERGGEGLRELGAVAVERECFHHAVGGGHVDVGDLLHGGVERHVDGLGDGAGEERLRGGHGAHVRERRDVARAVLAAAVGAVEDGVVLRAQVRRALDGHAAADVVVCFLDLRAGEAERLEHGEGWVGELRIAESEHLATEVVAERVAVEGEGDVEGGGGARRRWRRAAQG